MGYSYKDTPIWTGRYLWTEGYDQFTIKVDGEGLKRNLHNFLPSFDLSNNFNTDYYMGVGKILMEGMKEYVPYHKGTLSSSAYRDRGKSSDGIDISYAADYAEKVYDNPDGWNFRKTVHPLATDHWDQAYLRDHEDEFLMEVTDYTMDFLEKQGYNVQNVP